MSKVVIKQVHEVPTGRRCTRDVIVTLPEFDYDFMWRRLDCNFLKMDRITIGPGELGATHGSHAFYTCSLFREGLGSEDGVTPSGRKPIHQVKCTACVDATVWGT